MNKPLIWSLAAIAVIATVVLAVMLSRRPAPAPTEREPAPPAAGESPVAPPAAPTPETPAAAPAPTREVVRLIGTYLRPGVEPGQHYLRVEEVVAGPTPCRREGLLLVLADSALALQWQADERLEVLGAYLEADGACRVVLDRPDHALKTLAAPEPERPAEPATRPEPQPVRALATVSAVRDGTAFLIVDQVLEGTLPCAQVSLAAADRALEPGAQVELSGRYDPQGPVACQVRVLDPATDLRRIAPPPVTESVPTAPPVATVPATPTPDGGGPAFFLSGGVSYLDPIPLFQGSAGLGLSDQLKGMLTVGFGSGRIEKVLPSGEPIPTRVQAFLVEGTALFRVSGPFYLGASGGLLWLSGEYALPYPVSGSTRFAASTPLVGVVAGYELGMTLITLGVGMALGGGR